MNQRTMSVVAAAGLLLACACRGPSRLAGESYAVQGDPWSAKTGDAASATSGKADAGKEESAKTDGASAKSGPAGDPTILEQTEVAKGRAQALENENKQLKSDAASLTALVEQLKKENANLAQLADASSATRATADQELEKARQQVKALETRCRGMADDLLQERIQRVRVERELILAKVAEAEHQDAGH